MYFLLITLLMFVFPLVFIFAELFILKNNTEITFLNGTFYMPQYLTEVLEAAKRENLQVEKVFAMHAPPITGSEIESAVNKKIQETAK